VKRLTVNLVDVRRAVANYIRSEGCGCCGDYEVHKQDEDRLGEVLCVPKYKDGSGRNFSKFQSKS